MNRCKLVPDRWICLVLLVLGLSSVQAQSTGDTQKYSSTPGNSACRFFDGFSDNGDGTVTDTRYGLMWKRCAEGSTWDGKACSVTATEMNWAEAAKLAKSSRFSGHSNWQLPSRDALRTISGDYDKCKDNRDVKRQYAVSSSIVHAVQENNYPGWFWSSTPYEGNGNFFHVINFGDGYFHHDFNGYKYMVRLMRPVSPAANGFAAEFEAEYQKLIASENAFQVRQRELAVEAAQRRPQQELEEARRRDLRAKNEANTLLLAQGVQSLYLQAGRAQRTGGGMQINGVFFSASQLYELIVERFPNSDMAVKASDQLNAISQVEAMERMSGAKQSRDVCLANLRRREASCESPSSLPGCLAYVRLTYTCN